MPIATGGIQRVSVVFQRLSGLPHDEVVNNWYFDTAAHDVVSAAVIEAGLVAFYTALAGKLTNNILSSYNFNWYNITTLPSGPPWRVTPATIGGTMGSNPNPDQIAIVLSFHADLTGVPEFSGTGPGSRPAQSRRGRIYIGPTDQTTLFVDTTHRRTVIQPTTVTAITAAASAFQLVCKDGGSVSHWVVYSKALHTIHPVVGGFVDNEWDTQRRRGEPATTRTTWT